MTAKVEHRPAAGELFPQQPRARMISRGIELLERIDLRQHGGAYFPGFDNCLNAFDDRIKMAVVSNAEFHFVAATSFNHLIALADIHRHRLFAEHVLPCFGGRDGLRSMQVNRCGDVDRVDLFIA